MRTTSTEKKWIVIIFLLSGIVIGGLIGQFAASSKSLAWLNYGKNFGLSSATLDLSVLKITFGFEISITIAAIIGMIISILAYSWFIKH